VIETRRLGPVVGLGTFGTFDGDADAAAAVVGAALGAGTTVFDSSPMYGGAEVSLGSALTGRREGTAIATKIWTPDVAEGRRQYEAQIRAFGRVEIQQVHNLVAWREHLEWLEVEKAAGRVDRLGVTHYGAEALPELEEALRTGRFDTVQVPLNPLERACEERLLPLAEKLGVAVIAMRPLGGAAPARFGAVRRGLRHGTARLRAIRPSEREMAPLLPFGVETWAQALLKWALSDPRVDLVIPATSRPARAVENAAAGSPPWFGPEERRHIERLARARKG